MDFACQLHKKVIYLNEWIPTKQNENSILIDPSFDLVRRRVAKCWKVLQNPLPVIRSFRLIRGGFLTLFNISRWECWKIHFRLFGHSG